MNVGNHRKKNIYIIYIINKKLNYADAKQNK